MYNDILTRSEILDVTIPMAGRICSYSLTQDEAFLQFIDKSGVPLTSHDVRKLLIRLSLWLQEAYRTAPTQRKSKYCYDTESNIIQHLKNKSLSYRKDIYGQAVKNIHPYIRQFRIGNIIYRDYRCSSIHDYSFELDKKFFTESEIYTTTFFNTLYSGRFLKVCVPAPWLIELYRMAVKGYEMELIARKKLPIDLWVELCDLSELSLLDNSSISARKDLNIKTRG